MSCRFLRTVPFDEDQFRFHSYEDFETNCDLKCDLHDCNSDRLHILTYVPCGIT
ncbi:hypothetical protein YC2023_087330 [Brassica napus]